MPMKFLASLLKVFDPARPAETAGAVTRATGADRRSTVGVGPGPVQTQPVSGRSDVNVDRRFTASLLGIGSLRAAQAEAAERRVVEQLEQLGRDGRNSNLVPRLPVVLPRLISLVRRDDVTPQELADSLAPDPALVGELVRVANSPRYRRPRDIADLQEAVVVVGQRGLTELVIRASMRPIFSAHRGRFSRIAGSKVWDVTERCAHACAHLRDDPTDRFHAYLAGMAVNIGLIAALRVLDADYPEQRSPDSEAFHDALNRASAKLSARIARQWDFPSAVCDAIRRRARPQPEDRGEDLSWALRAADRAAKWHLLSPGLDAGELDILDESARRCYEELERSLAG